MRAFIKKNTFLVTIFSILIVLTVIIEFRAVLFSRFFYSYNQLNNLDIITTNFNDSSLHYEIANGFLDAFSIVSSFTLIFCTVLLEFSHQMHWGFSDTISAKIQKIIALYLTLVVLFQFAEIVLICLRKYASFYNLIVVHFLILILFTFQTIKRYSGHSFVEKQIASKFEIKQINRINVADLNKTDWYNEGYRNLLLSIRHIIFSLSIKNGTITLDGYKNVNFFIKRNVEKIKEPVLYLPIGREIAQSVLTSSSELLWREHYISFIYSNVFTLTHESNGDGSNQSNISNQKRIHFCVGYIIGISKSYLQNSISRNDFVHSIKQSMSFLETHSSDYYCTLIVKMSLLTIWRKLNVIIIRDVSVYRISSSIRLNSYERAYLERFTNDINSNTSFIYNIIKASWDQFYDVDHDPNLSQATWYNWIFAMQTLCINCDTSDLYGLYSVDFEKIIMRNKLYAL